MSEHHPGCCSTRGNLLRVVSHTAVKTVKTRSTCVARPTGGGGGSKETEGGDDGQDWELHCEVCSSVQLNWGLKEVLKVFYSIEKRYVLGLEVPEHSRSNLTRLKLHREERGKYENRKRVIDSSSSLLSSEAIILMVGWIWKIRLHSFVLAQSRWGWKTIPHMVFGHNRNPIKGPFPYLTGQEQTFRPLCRVPSQIQEAIQRMRSYRVLLHHGTAKRAKRSLCGYNSIAWWRPGIMYIAGPRRMWLEKCV